MQRRPRIVYRFDGWRVDALTVKVREAGRVVTVHALVAPRVNAYGHREILSLDLASAEDSWSSPTPTPACSPLSARRCPARPGSAHPHPLPAQSTHEGPALRAAARGPPGESAVTAGQLTA